MLEMSWITAILQLYSQEADLFKHVIVKRRNIRFIGTISLHIESPSYQTLYPATSICLNSQLH